MLNKLGEAHDRGLDKHGCKQQTYVTYNLVCCPLSLLSLQSPLRRHWCNCRRGCRCCAAPKKMPQGVHTLGTSITTRGSNRSFTPCNIACIVIATIVVIVAHVVAVVASLL